MSERFRGLRTAALALSLTGVAIGLHDVPRASAPADFTPFIEPVSDTEAGLTCYFSDKPTDSTRCEFTRPGNPYLQFTTLDLYDRGDENVMFLLAGTTVSTEIFGREINMDATMYEYERVLPNGEVKLVKLPISDAELGFAAGELFITDTFPETIAVRNSDDVIIGIREVREAVDIFIENNPKPQTET